MARIAVFVSLLFVLSLACDARFPARRFLRKQFKTVNGRRMAYVDVGSGDPIVFLHGNPTSSFVWRNVMPHLEGQGRLVAPDLIGFGDSEKLPPGDPSRYFMQHHANFLFGLLERLGVKEHVTFVLHDWGSPLGFLWAYRNRFNPDAVKGIAFMESVVAPVTSASMPGLAAFLGPLRGPAGEQLILRDNIFVEQVLPGSTLRNLTRREMNAYRKPFKRAGEDRRAMLTFERQFPLDGEPRDVVAMVDAYSKWMATAPFPKLLIVGDPGIILVGNELALARSWTKLTEVTVRGIHYLQEDSPDEIGGSISRWVGGIRASTGP